MNGLLEVNLVVFGLGHGVLGATDNRMGVWTQGCSLKKCPGCSSRHTWPQHGGRALSVEMLLHRARSQVNRPTGLTVSGGEPTDQAAEVSALIMGFKGAFPDAEIILYSGLRWSRLSTNHPELVSLIDVAITGPYVRTREATPLTGSANQEVRLLTPLAQHLYKGWLNWPLNVMQVGCVDSSRMVTVGIPNTDYMDKAANRSGATEVSWDVKREDAPR